MSRKSLVPAILAAVTLSAPAGAQQAIPGKNAYDVLYTRYLQAAREMAHESGASTHWMVGLAADRRARSVNDLVTIRVVESIVAEGSADTALAKKSNGASAVPKLFGLESKLPDWLDPTGLVDGNSNTGFNGGGTTSRRGDLTAVVTARVVEVLPNGDLVLEGAREVHINGDRQVIVLTGVVRPADILPDNSVLSPRVGQFRIQYFGQGLIKDNLKPGWIIRILNKLF